MSISGDYLRSLGCLAAGLSVTLTASAAQAGADMALSDFRRDVQPVLEKYCYECHGDGAHKGGVTLDDFGSAASLHDEKLWLRVLKNVRTGIMPPAEADPLPTATAEKLVTWIKHDGLGLDPAKPDPGRVTVRRLNRVEYRNTVRDLLGVDYPTQKEFPADDTGQGFDNIGDVLTISPLLLEKYLDAAQSIVEQAVVTKPRTVREAAILGREFVTIKADTTLPDPPKPAAPSVETPAVAVVAIPVAAPADAKPVAPVLVAEAAPAVPNAPAAGGRAGAVPGRAPPQGGFNRQRREPPASTRPAPAVEGNAVILSYYTPALVAAKHAVESAGKYQIDLDFVAQETYADDLFDLNKCQVVFAIDGEKLLDREFVREGYGRKFSFKFDRDLAAGEHEISMEITPVVPGTPQYRKLRVRLDTVTFRGPLAPEFWVKTPGYDKFFPRAVPADAKGRRAYAREILANFTRRAYRGPVDADTLDRLVALSEKVAAQPTHTFEDGVVQAIVATLASPTFIFREERTEPLKRGQTYPQVDDYALASRLSYFFWSSMPDDELLNQAAAHTLRKNLPAQIKRLLADGRSKEFVRNFTGQWLEARDIATVPIIALDVFLREHPNADYDKAKDLIAAIQAKPEESRTAEEQTALRQAQRTLGGLGRQTKPELTDPLRVAMRDETEMVFAHIINENRSVLELLESDYTFLNETLAKHYGIEGVTGSEMRKVILPPDSPRGGVLTQGTVLAVTSNPTRTSPVKRGLFILGAILGTPPAPPPPNIPPLEDAASPEKLRSLSLRETLALHATQPICASCHLRMDPIGLALENFNAMGAWRTTDMGQPVQPAGQLVTGEKFADVRQLKHVLATARRRDFYYCLSEKLLTYALGRAMDYRDTTTLDQLVATLESTGGNSTALLGAIVNSVPFQQRREIKNSIAAEPRSAQNASQRLAQDNR